MQSIGGKDSLGDGDEDVGEDVKVEDIDQVVVVEEEEDEYYDEEYGDEDYGEEGKTSGVKKSVRNETETTSMLRDEMMRIKQIVES